MKIFDILKKLDEQKKYYESIGMVKEMAEVESVQNELKKYIDVNVLSKRDASEEWEIAGSDISGYIDKIIHLLSIIGTKTKEELEDYYDVNKLKTIYYLIHNSNLELNAIADGMRKANVGYMPRYHKTQKDKKTGQAKLLKPEEQNVDLYHILMNYLSYEKGEYVHELSDFYQTYGTDSSRFLKLSDIQSDFRFYDDIYKVFEKTQLPKDLLKDIAQMRGSASITRGNFEFLFTLLFENGRFGTLETSADGDENKGDIIIDNHAIEVKVDTGSGGGRIGGQKGFNSVEAVVSSYQPVLSNFAKEVMEQIGSQIPEDNNDLMMAFESVVGPYLNGSIQLGINQTTSYEGKYRLADEVLLSIVQGVYDVIGSPNPKQQQWLHDGIVKVYSSIWKALVPNAEVQNSMEKTIKLFLQGRSLNDMLQDGAIIAPAEFDAFSQLMCLIELAEYANLEKFHYIFVIKTDKGLNDGQMTVLSNQEIQNMAKAATASKDAYMALERTHIRFKLPQTYGAASRAIRPDISLT